MKQHPSAISLVGFKTKEEVQSYIDHIPHARFELSYKMNQAFLDELEPIIQGRVVSAHAACPNQPIFPNFASHDPDVLEQSLEAVKRTLETCTRFGATTMVLHPGYVTDLAIPSENHARQALLDDPSFLPYIGVADGAICRTDYPESEGYQRHSRQAMKQLAFVAELGTQYGVTVAVENLNRSETTLLERHRNPGHTLECLWFILDVLNNERIEEMIPLLLTALEEGWDDECGGIYRYIDSEGGEPRGEREDDAFSTLIAETWDYKLWWVHVEALYALARFTAVSHDPAIKQWYEKVQEYTFTTFPAKEEATEWIQIRKRNGQPEERVIALPVKDPYHIIRALILLAELEGVRNVL